MTAEQPGEPLVDEALAPAIDERIVTGELLADLGPSLAGLEQQNKPSASRVIRAPRLTCRSLAQLHALRFRKTDCVARGHNHTRFLFVTVH